MYQALNLVNDLKDLRVNYRFSSPGFLDPHQVIDDRVEALYKLMKEISEKSKLLDELTRIICYVEYTVSTRELLRFIIVNKDLLNEEYLTPLISPLITKSRIYTTLALEKIKNDQRFEDFKIMLEISLICINNYDNPKRSRHKKGEAEQLVKKALNALKKPATLNSNINAIRLENLQESTFLVYSIEGKIKNKLFTEVLEYLDSINVNLVPLPTQARYRHYLLIALLKTALYAEPDISILPNLSSKLAKLSSTEDNFINFDLNIDRFLTIIYNYIISIIENSRDKNHSKEIQKLWEFLIKQLNMDSFDHHSEHDICFSIYKNDIYALILKNKLYTYHVAQNELNIIKNSKEHYDQFNSFIKNSDFFILNKGRNITLYTIGDSTQINLFGLRDHQNENILHSIDLINYSGIGIDILAEEFENFAVLYDSSLKDLQKFIESWKTHTANFSPPILAYDSNSIDFNINEIQDFISHNKNLIIIGHSSANFIDFNYSGLAINNKTVLNFNQMSTEIRLSKRSLGTLIYLSCEGSAGSKYRINKSISNEAIAYGYSKVISSNRKLLLSEAIDILQLLKQNKFSSSRELLATATNLDTYASRTFPYMITM